MKLDKKREKEKQRHETKFQKLHGTQQIFEKDEGTLQIFKNS